MSEVLYHISEEQGIALFEPRPTANGERIVWAIDDAHLRNYLVPRDCPRVTFSAGPATSPQDRQQFLGGSSAVVAIESSWVDRVKHARLHRYHLPREPFTCMDRIAGYFTSTESVVPLAVDVIEDPLSELRRRGVELRILDDLWALHDQVASSSLEFSMIRMRNAAPRKS